MADFVQGLLGHWETPHDIKIHFQYADGYPDVVSLAESTVATWRKPHTRFLVLCDQDNADCKVRKQRIIERIAVARRGAVDVRIVCRQLETWYLGGSGRARGSAAEVGGVRQIVNRAGTA